MRTIDKTKPVMVAGATGYVAGQLVRLLLEEGMTVHAAVRDPDAEEKLKDLDAIAAEAPGGIRYFKSDLLDEGSYAEAMEGCELVFHTASPFKIRIEDPQKELVDPAKFGTRNVLEQANRTASVKRVVVTGSCAAIYGDNADLKQTAGGVFTEEDWNTSSSLSHQPYSPYSFSKVEAEREAWSIAGRRERWDLVTVNPSLVIGPGINPHGTSESFRMVGRYGDGSMKAGAPRYGFGVVDVRDLAVAHFRAGFTPEAKGRYIASGHDTDLLEMGMSLLETYGDRHPIPRKALPKWLVWLMAPMVDKAMTRKMVALNVNLPRRGDNSKGKRELGLSYRPMKESMEDMFRQLIDAGVVKRG